MRRSPCRDANSPQVAAEKPAGEERVTLPPSLEGSRSLEFSAAKKAAVPGKNGGSWTIQATVKVGRKTIFERRSSLIFGLSDDIAFRDAECLAQLRTELGEVWHRMTCSPKETCRLDGGEEFKGTRAVKLVAKKTRKGKRYAWSCVAEAQTDYAGFQRRTTNDYVEEGDASRSSAAALHVEIAAVWLNATRGECLTYDDEFRTAPTQSPGLSNVENEAPVRRGAMRFIRDVYGASSNAEAVVNRAPPRV